MSNKPKKKTVVTTGNKKNQDRGPAQPRVRSTGTAPQADTEFTFSKDNYLWMGIGAVLVLVGMALMSGGSMPSPDVWDEDIIYSTRRTVLAPIVILAGLAVEVYAIFK